MGEFRLEKVTLIIKPPYEIGKLPGYTSPFLE